jgi:predicted SnoaL-like aldol condensation-catalyzing enzyme
MRVAAAVAILLASSAATLAPAPQASQVPSASARQPMCSQQVPQQQLDANKQLLLDFFNAPAGLTREQRSARIQSEDYIQHNPRFLRMDAITGATGRQAWVKAGDEANRRGITLVDLGGIRLRDPVILMAECDLVTAIYRGVLPDPDDKSKTYEAFAFEVFRVKDGKVTEHWDQVQLSAGWMNGTPRPAAR